MLKRSVLKGIVLLAVFGAFAGVAWRWGREAKQAGTLELSGSVDIRDVALSFPLGGRVAETLFEEGESAAKGAVLARLDDERFARKAAAAQAALARQQALLDKLLAGSRPEEIGQAEAETAAAEARLALAKLTLERKSRLSGTPSQAQAELDAATAARDEAAALVRAGRHALTLLRKGPRVEDVEAARAGLEVLRNEAALAAKDLADAVLTAPEDGVVLTKVVEPGSVVAPGAAVYVLSLSSAPRVRAYIDEPMLGAIAPGMAVEVVSDSRPDRPYRGTIGFIASSAEFTPKAVHTPELRSSLVFRFRVMIEDGDDLLRQGMPVTVRIPNRLRATGS